jgi:hypothetical protein
LRFAARQQRFNDRAYRRYADRAFRSYQSYPAYRDDYWYGGSYAYQPPYPVYTPDYRTYSYDSYGRYAGAPSYFYNYDDSYYYEADGDDYYSGGFDWKEMLFRSVITAFFSNGDNVGYFDSYPQQVYYDDDGYTPVHSYYPYHTFGYEPSFTYYEPAAYYGYDEYAHSGLPYEYSSFSSLPYGDMNSLYSGTVAGELIQRALVTGYYQGMLEGEAAREYGWGEDEYYDPYLYEQAIYDPYSTSIGNCRRYFSEGYEMGYLDAINNSDELAIADDGDIDLVSLLLTSVLDFRG